MLTYFQDIHLLVPVHDGCDGFLHVIIRWTESRVAPVEFTQKSVMVHELEGIPVIEEDISEALANSLDQSHMGVVVVPDGD